MRGNKEDKNIYFKSKMCGGSWLKKDMETRANCVRESVKQSE